MKCSNCSQDAAYEYKLTLKKSVFYCGKDLPKFLEARKKALLIGTTDEYAKAQEEALAILQIQPSEPEEVAEEPLAPKKKASKKKAE